MSPAKIWAETWEIDQKTYRTQHRLLDRHNISKISSSVRRADYPAYTSLGIVLEELRNNLSLGYRLYLATLRRYVTSPPPGFGSMFL